MILIELLSSHLHKLYHLAFGKLSILLFYKKLGYGGSNGFYRRGVFNKTVI